ncbi:MAG TPA: hypothetical protein VFX86_02125 [Candidatus Saccharimonadales bacterium]|nr:hypothetical protein [Candidatus Saccharimonadales bacterium]
MLGWWYSQGWVWVLKVIADNLKAVEENFSVPILLRTWFSPWKQIQTPPSFHQFFQAAIDNFVSRFIGAVIRTFVLLTALVLAFCILFLGLVGILLWPLIPFLVPALPIIAVAV